MGIHTQGSTTNEMAAYDHQVVFKHQIKFSGAYGALRQSGVLKQQMKFTILQVRLLLTFHNMFIICNMFTTTSHTGLAEICHCYF